MLLGLIFALVWTGLGMTLLPVGLYMMFRTRAFERWWVKNVYPSLLSHTRGIDHEDYLDYLYAELGISGRSPKDEQRKRYRYLFHSTGKRVCFYRFGGAIAFVTGVMSTGMVIYLLWIVVNI